MFQSIDKNETLLYEDIDFLFLFYGRIFQGSRPLV